MNKTLFLFLISLLFVFACSKSQDSSREIKTSESSPSQVATNKREFKTEEKFERGEPKTSASTSIGENHPPEVTSIKIIYASDNNPRDGLRVVAQAKDIDGDEVSFRYQWKRNGEKIVGAIGEVLEWQEDFKKGDKIEVEVIPFDGKSEGVWKAEGEFTIPNSPPKIISEPETKMEGGKFRYIVRAEDPDGDPVEFALKDAPKGMSIDSKTGLITWDFDEKDAGEYKVEIIASDTEGAKSVQMLTLKIPRTK
jgi:putative Ig domain-containing protein